MSSLESDFVKTALESGGSQNQQLIFQLLLRELTNLRTAVDMIKTEVGDIQITISSVQTSVQNSEKLWNEVKDIRQNVQQHEQTIFGPKGDNGLNGDIKALKEEVGKLTNFKIKAIAYATAISTVLIIIKDFIFTKI